MKKTKESFHFECASVKIPAVSMTQQLSIAMAVKEAKEEGDGGDAKAPWREPKEPEPAAPAPAKRKTEKMLSTSCKRSRKGEDGRSDQGGRTAKG